MIYIYVYTNTAHRWSNYSHTFRSRCSDTSTGSTFTIKDPQLTHSSMWSILTTHRENVQYLHNNFSLIQPATLIKSHWERLGLETQRCPTVAALNNTTTTQVSHSFLHVWCCLHMRDKRHMQQDSCSATLLASINDYLNPSLKAQTATRRS